MSTYNEVENRQDALERMLRFGGSPHHPITTAITTSPMPDLVDLWKALPRLRTLPDWIGLVQRNYLDRLQPSYTQPG
jgi:hypothetical protein